MFRLTPLSETPDEVVLRVEGWLEGAEVGVLSREIESWRQRDRQVVLDLTGLKDIEPAGLRLLSSWVGKGVSLRGGSGYLRALLTRHGIS